MIKQNNSSLNRRAFLRQSTQGMLALGTGAALLAVARAEDKPEQSSASTSKKIEPAHSGALEHTAELKGLRLKLGTPRVLAQTMPGVGGRCWFPDLLRFSTGEWMLTYSVNDDSNLNTANAQAVHISTGNDFRFEFQYDVNEFPNAGGDPRICLPDGRIIGPAFLLRPEPAGQARSFVTNRFIYDRGGRRYQVEPWAVRVEGFPRDVQKFTGRPSRTRYSHINWFSDILALEDGSWISTISARFVGDKLESTVAVASHDEGLNWRVLSIICGQEDTPTATEGFDEPCLVRLENGDLMCVSRTGNTKEPLYRAYSTDGGKSWSKVDQMEVWGVAPQIARLSNGVLMISTGRPGILNWFTTDARGKSWQSFDLLAHHNRVLEKKYHIQADIKQDTVEHQTTAYTAMVEASPNRIALVYDRNALGWKPLPPDHPDQSQIFMVEFEVERT